MFTVYVKNTEYDCLRCVGVCNFLEAHNDNVRILSLEDPEVCADFKSRFPEYLQFPQVFWCDTRIGSSEDFYSFYAENSVDYHFEPPKLKKPHRYILRVPQNNDIEKYKESLRGGV